MMFRWFVFKNKNDMRPKTLPHDYLIRADNGEVGAMIQASPDGKALILTPVQGTRVVPMFYGSGDKLTLFLERK